METLLSQGYQGTVYLVEKAGQKYVVKRPSGSWLTAWLRKRMLDREYAAYQRLAGIPGVPNCIDYLPGRELRLEFVDGESLRAAGEDLSDKLGFFERFQELIQAMHAAGVAHADMKRKENILVDARGRPWLIDFGAAVLANAAGGGFLFEQARRTDLNAWFKLKYQLLRVEPSADDLRLFQPTGAELVARRLRRFWRKLTRRQQRNAARKRSS